MVVKRSRIRAKTSPNVGGWGNIAKVKTTTIQTTHSKSVKVAQFQK